MLNTTIPNVKPNGKLPETHIPGCPGANKFKVWSFGETARNDRDGWDCEACKAMWVHDEIDDEIDDAPITIVSIPVKKIGFDPDVPADPENTAEIIDFMRSDTAEIIQFVNPDDTKEIIREFNTLTDTAQILDFIRKPTRTKFSIVWPDEYSDMADPTYWDSTGMVPRVDGEGAVALVYGQYGSHKTNVVLTLLFDMMLKADARIVYAAGEGARGVGKRRLPAHCAAHGMGVKELHGRFATIPAVPLLQLPSEVDALIDACRELKPHVVVIDTLATATAGLDENGSVFSALLADNGPIGRIKRELKCTVIILAHEGKDAGRGARGHSGLMGNVDAGIQITSEDGVARIKATVTKMRDGVDNFARHYRFDPAALMDKAVVPVPEFCSEDVYKSMAPAVREAKVKEAHQLQELVDVLTSLGAYEGGAKPEGVETGAFMDAIMLQRGVSVPTDKKELAAARHLVRMELDRQVKQSPNTFGAFRIGKSGAHWLWGIPSVP